MCNLKTFYHWRPATCFARQRCSFAIVLLEGVITSLGSRIRNAIHAYMGIDLGQQLPSYLPLTYDRIIVDLFVD